MKKKNPRRKPPAPVAGCSLATELEFYGCSMDPGAFNELLADMHHNMHRAWSPEQLLYRPSYSLVFVKAIRARSSESLPEEMILRRLRNLQKAGGFE